MHYLKGSIASGILAVPMAFKQAGLVFGSLFLIIIALAVTHAFTVLVSNIFHFIFYTSWVIWYYNKCRWGFHRIFAGGMILWPAVIQKQHMVFSSMDPKNSENIRNSYGK